MLRLATSCVLVLASCSFAPGRFSDVVVDPDATVEIDAKPPRLWRMVAAGDEYTCGIQMDSTLWCWGDNASGQLGTGVADQQWVAPRQIGTATWTAISADADHTCGIQSDGSLWCWGENEYGQIGNGTNTAAPDPVLVPGTYKAVDVGTFHTCGIRTDDSLWCWGYGGQGELGDGTYTSSSIPITSAGSWARVSVGRQATCATKPDGTLWCWGLGNSGTLGHGNNGSYPAPTQVGADTWTDISVTSFHACGIRSDGLLRCWGDDAGGQLGNGALGGASAPMPLAGTDEAGWLDVETGDDHTCARRAGTELWCWGRDQAGQIAAAPARVTIYDTPIRTAASVAVASFALGRFHSCALAMDGQMYCTGSDATGALGTGNGGRRNVPTRLPSLWRDVSAGGGTTCGVRDTSSVECWGANGSAQVGDLGTLAQQVPTPIASIAARTRVSVGRDHVCDVRASTETTCWGSNTDGELGTVPSGASPTAVTVSAPALASMSSSGHTCGLPTAALAGVVCWGRNDWGQVGNGGSTPPASPHTVFAGYTVRSVAAGGLHTCVVFPVDSSLWCWGNNEAGQLGINSIASTPAASAVTGTWQDVAAGEQHTCARDSALALHCWGGNEYGEVGIDSTTNALVPVAIGSAAWHALALGDDHTCGIQSDRSLWCWGRNRDGQLGNGSFVPSLIPVRVGTDIDWETVSAGSDHTCARKSDGSGWCWGRNRDGQLGDGTAFRVGWTVVE